MDPLKTPPRPASRPLAGTTPLRAKRVNSDGFQSATLEYARSDVVTDAGRIPVVSLQDFQKSLLPVVQLGPDKQTLDDKVIERIRVQCATDGLIVTTEDQNRWKHFPEDPSKVDVTEAVAFESFRDLWNGVIGCVETLYVDEVPIACIAYRPDQPQKSERPATTRPDCVVELRETTTVSSPADPKLPQWHWENTTTAMEFKKKDDENGENFIDDAGKLVYNCTHILRNDPCRRFTFGITIENTAMRLWHFSRSGIIMTQPINWIEDHAVVIHVFTSLVFASKTNLGYDPTIKRTLVGRAIQYEITLQDGDTYVTDDLPLFDFRADMAEGRATRVWKVFKRGGNQNDCFVLKDSWMFSDSRSEGDLMRDLLKNIDEKDHRYFLAVVSDGSVRLDGNLVDQTLGTIMRGIPTIIENKTIQQPRTYKDPKANVKGSQRNESQGRTPGFKEAYNANLHESGIVPRTHYRILFREVCQPLHDIRDLAVAFSLLAQTVDVLRILHQNRTVHGDLSTGNILSYNGKVKLADLEYSRLVDQERKHGFRTGTAEFMSIEVESGIYYFQPEPTVGRVAPIRRVEKKPFRYGMIHDLESVWWIAVWFLFCTHPIGSTHNPKILDIAASLFTRHYQRDARIGMLSTDNGWASSVEALPVEFSALADQLGGFRLHYIRMAKKTFESLTPGGIAYKISTDYLEDDEKGRDAYDIASYYLSSSSDTLPVELTTTPAPKRKEAPKPEHPEPDEPSGSKRTRRE